MSETSPPEATPTTLGERLSRARDRAGLTQKDVAGKFNITEQAVSAWERNAARPDVTKITQLARLYGVTEGDLLNPEVVEYALASHGRRLRLINRIQRGMWEELAEGDRDEERSIVVENNHGVSDRAFALEITGESNLPEFRPGDVVIIDPDPAPLPGDMVAARFGEGPRVFRRYRPKGRDNAGREVIDLVPLNPDWPTLHIDAGNAGEIIGVMVEHRRYRTRSGSRFRGP